MRASEKARADASNSIHSWFYSLLNLLPFFHLILLYRIVSFRWSKLMLSKLSVLILPLLVSFLLLLLQPLSICMCPCYFTLIFAQASVTYLWSCVCVYVCESGYASRPTLGVQTKKRFVYKQIFQNITSSFFCTS